MGWLIATLVLAAVVVMGYLVFSDGDDDTLGPINNVGGGDDHEFPPRRE